MDTTTAHAVPQESPPPAPRRSPRVYAATVVAAVYVLLAVSAPLIVRYGPDPDPAAATALVPVAASVAPRCASAPEFGLACGSRLAAPGE